MKSLPPPVSTIKVALQFERQDRVSVGRLHYRERCIFFEYDTHFLSVDMDISPFHLPKQVGVMQFDPALFQGLPGVFNDSLPDGWGKLLLDREIRSHGVQPESLTPVDRLAHVGQYGMGALVYEPDYSDVLDNGVVDLDSLANLASEVLEGGSSAVFEELLQLNGSSAGVRPKALIGVNKDKSSVIYGVHDIPKNYDYWLVKFTNSSEDLNAGAVEFVYSQMAKAAGIEMSDTHLFPAQHSAGFYATERFDRSRNHRLHLHSACGLLHSDFRTPSLDYKDLLHLTHILTQDFSEVRKMYRLAVFNVLAHNQDDHAKNFSYLMNEKGQWCLSPAYDLTFSSGLGGEQNTMVLGKGKHITTADLMRLGGLAELSSREISESIEQVQDTLSQWPKLAKLAGITDGQIKRISQLIM